MVRLILNEIQMNPPFPREGLKGTEDIRASSRIQINGDDVTPRLLMIRLAVWVETASQGPPLPTCLFRQPTGEVSSHRITLHRSRLYHIIGHHPHHQFHNHNGNYLFEYSLHCRQQHRVFIMFIRFPGVFEARSPSRIGITISLSQT